MGDWITRHPGTFGAVMAALLAFAAYDMYRAGMAVGIARVMSDNPRLRSEALGG